MADNVAPSTDPTVATDDVAGVHYQRIKLVTAEDGASEPIGDTDHGTTRALHVDPRPSMVVSPHTDSSGLTVATTAYTAGDVLGSGWSFADAVRTAGGTGRVLGAILVDDADVLVAADLYLASAAITFGVDNAAPTISDADALKLLPGPIGLTMMDLGGVRIGQAGGLGIPYVCDATTLFVYAITRVGHSFFGAATDLSLRLFLQRD